MKTVCEICGCESTQIIGKQELGKTAWFAHIYTIARHLQGVSVRKIAREIGKSRVTAYNSLYTISEIQNHETYGPMLAEVVQKLKLSNDLLEKFRRIYTVKTTAKPSRIAKPKEATRWLFNEGCEYVKTMHSFDINDKAIERACRNAERFFEKYGKGHRPINEIVNNRKAYQ